MFNFPLFPQEASSVAPWVDALMGYVFAIAAFFALAIAVAIIYFSIHYYHDSPADRSAPPTHNLPLELVWTIIPLGIVMTIFFGGTYLFLDMRQPPKDAAQIYVVGKQWMWKLQHPEGPREINELHIPVGKPVELLMTSQDVIHDFFVPDFRVKQDVLPGRFTTEWFEATKPGRYHLFCAQYCGSAHSAMIGWIVAMAPADYALWLQHAEEAPGVSGTLSMADEGHHLFNRLGCAACHIGGDHSRAPELGGLYGSRVDLEGGGSALADETYLRESIVKPNAKIVRGYGPLMPTFQGQVDESQLEQLIAYIKSLKAGA